MITRKGLIPHSLFALLLFFTLSIFPSCTPAKKFEKDCYLCNQVNQKEVETVLIDFTYNDQIRNISEVGISQLTSEIKTLRGGHKFIECGCVGDVLVYHLWCADDHTYQLFLKLLPKQQFELIGIGDAEFDHP